jgi:hypothetical protein
VEDGPLDNAEGLLLESGLMQGRGCKCTAAAAIAMACSVSQISKVSALVSFLYKVTVWKTFEDFGLLGIPWMGLCLFACLCLSLSDCLGLSLCHHSLELRTLEVDTTQEPHQDTWSQWAATQGGKSLLSLSLSFSLSPTPRNLSLLLLL